MLAFRPVGYIVGWLVLALGFVMFLPLAVDVALGDGNAPGFAEAAVLTIAFGAGLTLACAQAGDLRLGLRQAFALTTVTWMVYPAVGALPFMLGLPGLGPTDAYFEAMSAMTTTGATVITGLDDLPHGILLWRGLLQWIGGMGIVLMALLLLPVLNVGGMQLLRASDFNTLGKIMPRTKQIALSIGSVYLGLTVACAMGYEASGMNGFNAAVHAMTTLSTGGMGTSDSSFAGFSPAAQYVSTVFMLLGSLSFARFVQLARGDAGALWHDTQIRAFLAVYVAFVLGMLVARLAGSARLDETVVREVAFNVASMLSSTGYASADFILWGNPSVMIFFIIMLIGGCSGSTAGGVKVFRYELLFSAVRAELRRLYRPNIVILARYQGRTVSPQVMDSVIAFFMLYFLSLGIIAVVLVLLGLDPMSAITGAASCLGNVGPGLSPEIGPVASYVDVPGAAKWVMSAAMMIGRLEIMVVFVLFSTAYWRG